MSFSRAAIVLSGVLLSVLALATDYGAYSRRLTEARSDAAKVAILKELQSQLPDGSPLLEFIQPATAGDTADPETIQTAEQMVALRAAVRGESAPTTDVRKAASSITSSPLYRDTGQKKASNWIERALDRLRFRPRDSSRSERSTDSQSVSYAVDVLVALVWIGLALGVAALLYLAFRQFSWRKTLKRKAMALLEDDEPLRSADEWLVQADQLAAQGDHRGAVRCLYLACLLRLDENGVARFDRSQTNWEHFARIQASPSLPAGLEFREPTRAFDRIWYGADVRGQGDVDRFRAFYLSLMGHFGGKH